jgi:putative colanic acid biosynthesis glycosyltransferase
MAQEPHTYSSGAGIIATIPPGASQPRRIEGTLAMGRPDPAPLAAGVESSPLVSIVTVALDAGDDLLATAASIDAQEFCDYEHVVKDGGSRDGSLARLPSSPARRVVVAPDHGIYDAMNAALWACRGQYVVFLNAGDRLTSPGSLAALARGIGDLGAPDLVYFDYCTREPPLPVRNPRRLTRFFLYRTMLCHQSYALRRDRLLELGGFDTRLAVAADHDLLARGVLGRRIRAGRVQAVLTEYKGGGFSTLPQNRASLESDVRAIRRRWFTKRERALLATAYALTLPGLRMWLLSRPGLSWFRRGYRYAVNLLQAR